MSKLLQAFVITCAMALCGIAQAAISFSSGGSLTAWNGTPTYVTISNANLSGASTGQGDPTLAGTFGLLSETFTPSSSFTLGSVNILLSVNNITNPTYTINLYDLGPAGTVSVSAGAANYNPFTPSPASIALLLTDTVTFPATTGGEVQGTFTLASGVPLNANEEYAFELLTPSADGQNGLLWFRGSTADPGGQMFSGGDGANSAGAATRNTLLTNGQAGGAPRTGAMALYPVPEPGTIVLLGFGSVGLFAAAMKRRRK
jgi:hypothetical protein